MRMETSKKQPLVVQNNGLIVDSSNGMKKNQLKILYFLISCITRDDEMFYPLEVDFKTLLSVINYDTAKGGKNEYLTKLLKDMSKNSYYIHDDAAKVVTCYPWFGYIRIEYDGGISSGKALFKFNEDLSKYLLQQTRNFTQYQFGFIRSLSSIYGIKLYNLMRMFAYTGSVDMPLEKLRGSLNLLNPETGADRYSDYRMLAKKVLSAAIEEINVKTDIVVSYSPIKDSADKRRTAGVHFEIAEKSVVPSHAVPKTTARQLSVPGDRPIRIIALASDNTPIQFVSA